MLASMDQRHEKPKSKSKAKPPSYLEDLELPPSDSEEDDEMERPEIEHEPVRRARRAAGIPTNGFALSAKEQKKRERNSVIEAQRLERSRQEALRDDRGDAFAVVVGSKTSVLDGEVGADANVNDIIIDNFSVSAKGKELLKKKRYGLVGPNGKGKINLVEVACMAQNPGAHEHRRGFGGAGSGWGWEKCG